MSNLLPPSVSRRTRWAGSTGFRPVLVGLGVLALLAPSAPGAQVVVQEAKLALIREGQTLANTAAAIAAARATDRDNDGTLEPLGARAAGSGQPFPSGGGLLPVGSAVATTDGWGTPLGYCAWDHGSTRGAAPGTSFSVTSPVAGTLIAAPDTTGNGVMLAVIFAGPNRTFDTTCAALMIGGVAAGDDYVVVRDLQQTMLTAGVSYNRPPVDRETTASGASSLQQLLATHNAAIAAGTHGTLIEGEVRLVKINNSLWRFSPNGASAGYLAIDANGNRTTAGVASGTPTFISVTATDSSAVRVASLEVLNGMTVSGPTTINNTGTAPTTIGNASSQTTVGGPLDVNGLLRALAGIQTTSIGPLTSGTMTVTTGGGSISSNGGAIATGGGAITTSGGALNTGSGSITSTGTGTFGALVVNGTGSVSGLLTASGGIATSGSNIATGGGAITTGGGSINAGTGSGTFGSLGVAGAGTFGSLSVGGNVVAGGSGSFQGLASTGTNDLMGTNTLTGNTDINSGAATGTTSIGTGANAGAVTIGRSGGSLAVNSAASFSGGITGTGATTLTGATNINTSGAGATNIGNAGSTTTMLGTLALNATGSGTTTIGNASSPTTVGGTLGVTGASTFTGAAAFNGGLTTPSATITGGAINGTPIGATTPSTGAFTTLSSSGGIRVGTTANCTSGTHDGTLRFTNAKLQVCVAGSWEDVGTGSSARSARVTTSNSTFAAGTVFGADVVSVVYDTLGAATSAIANNALRVPTTGFYLVQGDVTSCPQVTHSTGVYIRVNGSNLAVAGNGLVGGCNSAQTNGVFRLNANDVISMHIYDSATSATGSATGSLSITWMGSAAGGGGGALGGWALTGNATSSARNGSTGSYLGTSSAQPLSIATTNATAQDIRFFTGNGGGTQSMTTSGIGFVGIGTPSPQVNLDVAGVTRLGNSVAPRWPTTGAGLEVSYETRANFKGGGLNSSPDYATINAITRTATSPSTFTGAGQLFLNTSGGTVAVGFWGYTDISGGMVVNGRVGIGTPSPSQMLHVVGSGLATSWLATSDARFKTGVAPLTGALATLERLQGVSYRWNRQAFPERRFAAGLQYGVIAQQLEAVLPDLVETGDDGYKSVNYTGLIPLLIEGAKEQQVQLRAAEKKLEDHGKRLEAQQATLDEHGERLNQHQRRIARAERLIGRLDERTGKLEVRIGEVDEKIVRLTERADGAEGFMARFDTSREGTLAVKTPNFQVSNLTAERAEIAELIAQRIEAEEAKFKKIEATEGKMTGALQAQSVSAQRVATGERELFVSYGTIAPLFEVPEGAHFVVTLTSPDGSYASATVVRAGGQLRVMPSAAQGIDLVPQGTQVGVVAPSRRVKASWLRTG